MQTVLGERSANPSGSLPFKPFPLKDNGKEFMAEFSFRLRE